MKVKDVMTSEVVRVLPGASLKEAARLMVECRISGLPVVDESGGVLGVISEGDLLVKERGAPRDAGGPLAWLIGARGNNGWAKLEARVVGEAMTSPAATIGPERPVAAAAALMLAREVNRLPVVDRDERLVGIVTRADLVRAFARSDDAVAREIRDEVIRRQMWLDEDAVTVEVAAGEVVLRGRVERRDDAEVLPKLAAKVPGVVAVCSELTWREDA